MLVHRNRPMCTLRLHPRRLVFLRATGWESCHLGAYRLYETDPSVPSWPGCLQSWRLSRQRHSSPSSENDRVKHWGLILSAPWTFNLSPPGELFTRYYGDDDVSSALWSNSTCDLWLQFVNVKLIISRLQIIFASFWMLQSEQNQYQLPLSRDRTTQSSIFTACLRDCLLN